MEGKIFLEDFRIFEKILRKKYKMANDDHINSVLSKPLLNDHATKIRRFIHIRNLLAHNNNERVCEFVTFKPKLVDDLKEIIRFSSLPNSIMNHCVPIREIISAKLSDPILRYIKEMKRLNINSIPIIENGLLVGLFLESSIIELLTESGEFRIDSETTFMSIQEKINFIGDEKYIKFVSENMTIEEVYDYNEWLYRNGERIKIFFVTENGGNNEKILGLFTPTRISTFSYGGSYGKHE